MKPYQMLLFWWAWMKTIDKELRLIGHFLDLNQNTTIFIFHCHRFILSIGSCVFNAMLNGNFTEQGPIIISDSEPQVFLLLLRFLYTDNVSFIDTNYVI